MAADNPDYKSWFSSGYTPADIYAAYPDQYQDYLAYYAGRVPGYDSRFDVTPPPAPPQVNNWGGVYQGPQVGSIGAGYTGGAYTGLGGAPASASAPSRGYGYGYVPPASAAGWAAPAPIPAQATAYQGNNGAMPARLGYAPRQQQQPAAQQPAATQRGFSNAAWNNLRYGTPFEFNGHTYTNQYNYLHDTLGAANNQAQGWEQLNAYGQPLGTLGPVNNKITNSRLRHPYSLTKKGPGPGDRIGEVSPPHGTGGIKPTNGGGYTGGGNQYNDLINWRI